jgi:hypothetical protein
MRLTTIVSGGQTGADRGGLDAAIALDLAFGGWAPAGWRSEDGQIPDIYRERMRCTSSSNYGIRTRLNIQDSDGTLIVSFAESPGGGTAYTIEQCEKQDKAHIHVVLPRGGRTQMPNAVADGIREWLDKANINVLNVAGPRESKEAGIQEAVRDLLVWVLEDQIVATPTRDEVWRGVFSAVDGAKFSSSPTAAGASDAGTPPPSVSPDVVVPAAAPVAFCEHNPQRECSTCMMARWSDVPRRGMHQGDR